MRCSEDGDSHPECPQHELASSAVFSPIAVVVTQSSPFQSETRGCRDAGKRDRQRCWHFNSNHEVMQNICYSSVQSLHSLAGLLPASCMDRVTSAHS